MDASIVSNVLTQCKLTIDLCTNNVMYHVARVIATEMAAYPESLQEILIILVYKALSALLETLNRTVSPPFNTITIFIILLT